jgi:hypothetical protein
MIHSESMLIALSLLSGSSTPSTLPDEGVVKNAFDVITSDLHDGYHDLSGKENLLLREVIENNKKKYIMLAGDKVCWSRTSISNNTKTSNKICWSKSSSSGSKSSGSKSSGSKSGSKSSGSQKK